MLLSSFLMFVISFLLLLLLVNIYEEGDAEDAIIAGSVGASELIGTVLAAFSFTRTSWPRAAETLAACHSLFAFFFLWIFVSCVGKMLAQRYKSRKESTQG